MAWISSLRLIRSNWACPAGLASHHMYAAACITAVQLWLNDHMTDKMLCINQNYFSWYLISKLGLSVLVYFWCWRFAPWKAGTEQLLLPGENKTQIGAYDVGASVQMWFWSIGLALVSHIHTHVQEKRSWLNCFGIKAFCPNYSNERTWKPSSWENGGKWLAFYRGRTEQHLKRDQCWTPERTRKRERPRTIWCFTVEES